ncbi:MAG: PaaI family thioesterase [Deltaproteobacteria bacterium]|nr:PaaI family thioesterase [Deltaproteobacteria bacterium]
MNKLHESYQHIFPHKDNFGELVGYDILEAKPGYARTVLTIEKKHLSPSGACHGGTLSTFVDFSMGAAIFLSLKKGELCSTIEFKINYISPAKLNDKLVCDAKIKSKGKSHAVVECHVFRPDEEDKRDVAIALGTYNIYSTQK